jgi:uncharacterized membrane protein YeaQ/YmgE (transglycosylase-associated protein family)
MNILWWIVVGIIAGALAKMVVPGEGPGGILGDLIVGIVGALIAGFLGVGFAGFFGSILTAFIGAAILLFLMRAFTRNRTAM